ncbi:Complement factor H, partial [Varanus komodoensis]
MKKWLVCITQFLLWMSCASQNMCKLPEIDFGEIVKNKKSDYLVSERIQYMCHPGYDMEGSDWTTCKEDGWIPPPKCLAPCSVTKEQLDAKNLLLHGRQRHSEIIKHGGKMEFVCWQGYTIVSPSVRTCVDGNLELPTCQPSAWVLKLRPVGRIRPAMAIHLARTTVQRTHMNACCVGGEVVARLLRDDFGFAGRSPSEPLPPHMPNAALRMPDVPGREPSITQATISRRLLPLAWNFSTPVVCTPPEIDKGDFLPNKSKYEFDETIRVVCHPGYMLEGRDNTFKCTKYGWLPYPKCISKRCDYPHVQNGVLSWSNIYYSDVNFPKKMGDAINYRCNHGFLAGNKQHWDKIRCTSIGWDPEPECFKQCFPPKFLPHGHVIHNHRENFIEGDNISFNCDERYHSEHQPPKAMCTKNDWSPMLKCFPTAPCTIAKQQLEAKNLFLSGSQRHSEIVQTNQMLQFMCEEGRVLTAPAVQKCLDGHMDLPSCISERGKNCSHPPTIQNGDIVTWYQEQYTSGSSVEFKCQKYYAMEGHNKSFCDNGNWTKVPACLEPCRISLAEMEGQKIELNSNETGFQNMYVQRGHSVELTCKSGYSLVTNPSQVAFVIQCVGKPIVFPECKEITCNSPSVAAGTFRPQRNVYQYEDFILITCDSSSRVDKEQHFAECTRNGWSPAPECGNRTCREPPTVANGDIVKGAANSYPPGHQVHYQCYEGFAMKGSATVTCERKTWSEPPRCEDTTCPPPPGIANGQIKGQRKQKYLHMEWVHYLCFPGYLLTGNPTVRCLDKQWTEAPICRERGRNCSRSPTIENGVMITFYQKQYTSGSSVEFRCQGSYVMEGYSRSFCDNGSWTKLPICLAPCKISLAEIENWNLEVRSEEKGSDNVYVRRGDSVELACKPGYDPATNSSESAFVIHCNGKPIVYPECKDAEGKCPLPPLIENGDIVNIPKTEYLPGESVQYQCQNFYKMEGSPTVTCNNGDWSAEPRCLASEEDMGRNNIKLRWKSDTKLYSESGDTIEFTCIHDFSLAQGSPPFRAQCRDGTITYPRCRISSNKWDWLMGLANGTFRPRRKLYRGGDIIRIDCEDGLQAGGAEKIAECTNGGWSPPPKC